MILYPIHLGFKLQKQPFRVFRGLCHISSFFVTKLCFSVFLLNSIEDKDSRFISGQQFRLVIPVSLPLKIHI